MSSRNVTKKQQQTTTTQTQQQNQTPHTTPNNVKQFKKLSQQIATTSHINPKQC